MKARFATALALFVISPAFAQAPAAPQPWYEGGTLQKATVVEWKKATPADQLATAGDFLASISAVTDISKLDPAAIEALKARAQSLVGCVNQSANAPDVEADQTVAHLVVMCALMKR